MNRIKISPLALESVRQTPSVNQQAVEFDLSPSSISPSLARANSPAIHADSRVFQGFPASSETCSFFVPLHYEKNYAYPLIVWLHADGGGADQAQQVAMNTSQRNFVGMAVPSPLAIGSDEAAGECSWDQEMETIESAHESVASGIDQARLRFNINPRRIFLAGAGSGGTMAFRIAFQSPELFAGVVSMGGGLPDEMPFRDWSRSRRLPVFLAHDRGSFEFTEDVLCQQLRLLYIAGFAVTLRQYPSSHPLLAAGPLSDVNRWIMETIG